MLKGFFAFIKQGNVVDLAVAVVLGAAFGAVVNALVDNVLMPLIATVANEPDFDNLFAVHIPGFDGPPLRFGILLTALVNFLLIAAAIYFIVIIPMNRLIAVRNARLGAAEEEPEENIALLREIRDQLRAQTEITNPAYIQSLVEAQRAADEEKQAREEAEQKSGLLGKAKDIVWGKSS